MRDESIKVRPAQAEDGDALKTILRETFDSTWRPNIRSEAVQAYLDANRGNRYVDLYWRDFWVAEQGATVVGLIHWQDNFIHALHVPARQARRGIGRQLLNLAESAISRTGACEVRLETDTFNEPSRAFYTACGYREAGRYPDEEWDSDLTTVLFIKAL